MADRGTVIGVTSTHVAPTVVGQWTPYALEAIDWNIPAVGVSMSPINPIQGQLWPRGNQS